MSCHAPGIRRARSSEGPPDEDGSECGPRSEPARVPSVPTMNFWKLKLRILRIGVPGIAGRGKGNTLGGGSSSPPSDRAGKVYPAPNPPPPLFCNKSDKKKRFSCHLTFLER